MCVCVPASVTCICERDVVRGGNGNGVAVGIAVGIGTGIGIGTGVAANDNGTALRINERHQKVIDSLSFVPVSICACICAIGSCKADPLHTLDLNIH